MIHGFTVINGKKPEAIPSLKITKHGIFINVEARRLLGLPTRIQIGIDEAGHRLAICPVTEGGIALSCGHTSNRGILDQVTAAFGDGRGLVGRMTGDGGAMIFENWEGA